MIILDTNVISALMIAPPDPLVLAWLDRRRPGELCTTSVNVLEIRFGLLSMAAGRRQAGLIAAFDRFIAEILENRVLVFDLAAAERAAALEARRRSLGRTVGGRDAQIAGIAQAHAAAVCTRNVRHFEDAEVTIHDPWAPP